MSRDRPSIRPWLVAIAIASLVLLAPACGRGGTTAPNTFSIVLTWSAEPEDLDAHLLTPSIEGRVYEVDWFSQGSVSAAPYAALDVDVTWGHGPEIITIARRFAGTYRFAVHNYDDEDDASSSRLFDVSGAVVEVIDDDCRLVARFRVGDVVNPGPGTWWHVFDISGSTGRITPVNRLSVSKPFATPEGADVAHVDPASGDPWLKPTREDGQPSR